MFEDPLRRLVGGSPPDGAPADQVLTTEQNLGRTVPAWEIEFRWKELVIYWEGEKGCQFEAGWGVEPGVTYVPTRERWDQAVPTWLVGRFDEVVARLQSDPGHVLRFEPGPVSGRGVEVTR